jgi:hypothetical protein
MIEKQTSSGLPKILAILGLLAILTSCALLVFAFAAPNSATELIYQVAGGRPQPETIEVTRVVTEIVTQIVTATTEPTPTGAPIIARDINLGQETIILSNSENFEREWRSGRPLLTTEAVFEGDVAFIPSGNNNILDSFGTVGYEPDQVRYLTLKIFLLRPDASLLVQVNSDDGWDHRWGFDGQPTFNGYQAETWIRAGETLDLPAQEWIEVTLDLIDHLHLTPGQEVRGLAFAGDDGNMIYDAVALASSGD